MPEAVRANRIVRNCALILIVFVAALAAMMIVIHAWGAYKKIQPMSETLEIGLWVAIALAALALLPSA